MELSHPAVYLELALTTQAGTVEGAASLFSTGSS